MSVNIYEWREKLKNKRIFIWGASIGGTQADKCLERNGMQVEAYCDNDIAKQGSLHNGKRIISPNTLKNGGVSNKAIIIASYAYEVIYNQIQNMGIECEIYIYLLYDPCHLKNRSLYSEQEKKIIRSLYSKEAYTEELLELILEKGFLNCDGFGGIDQYLGYGGIDQYYYDNIVELIKEQELTLLDVGSYIGDSALQMRKIFGDRLNEIYAFEPNKENCFKIKEKQIQNLKLFEYGLGKVNGYINFSEKGPFFRASGEKNGIPTKIIKLDDLDISIKGKCILKLDIEGTELDCLEGAREFIRRYKPYIAVCVYHKEKDVMKLPQYIKGLVSEYKFYLRGGMHTVCYAFPEEEN